MDMQKAEAGLTLLKLLGDFWGSVRPGKKDEAGQGAAGIEERYIEIRSRILGIQTDNDDLRLEVQALRDKLRFKCVLVRHTDDGALWDEGATDPGPYCTACWDGKREAIRLNVTIASSLCPVCDQYYEVSDETRAKRGFPALHKGVGIMAFGETITGNLRNKQF
jgi:hypothetical protein